MTINVEILEAGPVNLDGMDKSDLHKFVAATRGVCPLRAAKRMFPKKPQHVLKAIRLLNWYAQNKVTAMSCRARGEIGYATRYEEICEGIYGCLPEYARW